MQFYCIKISQYFPKLYEPFGEGINVKVDLAIYAAKADIRASLKTEVDKLDIDKLVPVPVDLSKLNEAVKIVLLKRVIMIN